MFHLKSNQHECLVHLLILQGRDREIPNEMHI